MNLTVHQNIVIQNLKINNITSSSILQIGSAGIIKSYSQQYPMQGEGTDTGEASGETAGTTASGSQQQEGMRFVPLPAAT